MGRHVGWLRVPPGRWKAVCTADDWGACWDRLLRITTTDARVEKTVLAEGRHPARTGVRKTP